MGSNAFDAFINKRMMPPLIHLDLIVTTKCNLYCSYCFMENKRPISMSSELMEQAVAMHFEYSRQQKEIQATFIGGEPLLEIDLIEECVKLYRRLATEYCKSVGFALTTNGTLLDISMAEKLAMLNVKYLLSIDGAEHMHDKYRHFPDGSPTWKLITGRLGELKRYQPWQGARVTVNPDTVYGLAEGVRELFECGINQFIIGVATGITWNDDDIQAYSDQMFLIADYHNKMKKKGAPIRLTIFEFDTERELARLKGQWGCGAGRGRLSVDPTGAITGCAKIQGCNNGNGIFVFGNVRDGITNLKNRYMLNWDNMSMRTKCQECDIADCCSGGCPAVNFAETGNPFVPSEHNCKFTRMYLKISEALNVN